mmetsp:Transcript_43098/g.111699  ORF Transcript_43098/g.111699 Transcript_43098/m.111699 type:complete len:92 (-) Transcript_43098:7-282(-)
MFSYLNEYVPNPHAHHLHFRAHISSACPILSRDNALPDHAVSMSYLTSIIPLSPLPLPLPPPLIPSPFAMRGHSIDGRVLRWADVYSIKRR